MFTYISMCLVFWGMGTASVYLVDVCVFFLIHRLLINYNLVAALRKRIGLKYCQLKV